MSEQKLTVVVGADVSQLNKGLATAENSLKKFQKSTVNTGQALTNISRIAQDAPFGFIAIQNNLDPLIQSFGQLKQQSGGTGAALKALFASLAGPAGIALGFSLVASAATTLIQKYGSLGNAFRELTGSLSDAEKYQQGYNKAVVEGIGNAGKEKAELTALIGVAKNETISREGRQQAIDKLKQAYPGYLSSLSLENASSLEIANAINKINQSLLLKAKIQGAEKFIADQEAKKYELLSKPIEDNIGLLDKFAAALNFASGKQGAAAVGLLTSAQNNLGQALGSVDKQAELANKQLQYLYNQLAEIQGITNKAPVVPKAVKTTAGAVKVPIIPDPVSVTNFTQTADRLINDQFKKDTPVNVPIIPTLPASVTEQFTKFAELQKTLYDNKQQAEYFARWENFAMTVGQNLSNLFLALAANGKNAFETIKESIASMLKALAAAVVKAAVFAGIMSAVNIASGGTAGFIGNFTKALGFGGLGQTGPNFAGVNGGGGGQVQFRLAGSDLVGSIQRTQGRINRVG